MSPSRVAATRAAAPNATTTRTTPAPRAGQRNLSGAAAAACSQSSHASQPAVVVLGFAVEVFRDLGVRQDRQLLVPDAVEHNVGYLLGVARAAGQAAGAEPAPLRWQRRRLHALR